MYEILNMPILQYHPPKKKLLDKRKAEGGYYTAECENCGSTFYPERSNAKYCSPNCGLIQHRMAVTNGTAMKRGGAIEKKSTTTWPSGDLIFVGKSNIYKFLIETGHSSFNRNKGKLNEWLVEMPMDGEAYKTPYSDKIKIARLSPQRWRLYVLK